MERNNKHVELNKAGEIVYHHSKEIMHLYTNMQNLLDDLTNKASGKLAIGASYTFGEYVIPHIVAYLKTHYPLIRPKITIANTKRIAEWVTTNQLEIGIVDGEVSQTNLSFEPFAEDFMYIIASPSHPKVGRCDLKLIDLADETWIVREATSGSRAATEKLFRKHGFYPKNIMEFGSTQLIKESVATGLGVTLLSHYTIQKEISWGTLKILEVVDLPVSRQFSLIARTTNFRTKALDVFINILKKNEGFPVIP